MSLRWADPCLAAGRFGLLEQLDLAGRLEAGYGAEVGWRPCLGQAQRLGPQVLVAEEALDALAVADQSAQLHASPSRNGRLSSSRTRLSGRRASRSFASGGRST